MPSLFNFFLSLADITMQDHMVIYDNEKGKIGWIRAPCDRAPKFGPSSSSALLYSVYIVIHPPTPLNSNFYFSEQRQYGSWVWGRLLLASIPPGDHWSSQRRLPSLLPFKQRAICQGPRGRPLEWQKQQKDGHGGWCVFFRKGEKLAHVNIIMFIWNITMITLLRVQSFRTFSVYIRYLVFFLLMWYILRFQSRCLATMVLFKTCKPNG